METGEAVPVPYRLLDRKGDGRGWLAELMRRDWLSADIRQVFAVTLLPGAVRGNHYHIRKTEWFCLVQGECLFFIRDMQKNSSEEELLNSDHLSLIEVPPYLAHAFENRGRRQALLIVGVSEEYKPEDPDTYHVRLR